MTPLINFLRQRPRAASALFWVVAVLVTITCISWQDTTGPTYPLNGEVKTARGQVFFKFLRSETIGTTLKIMLPGPVPDGISGWVRYRRYRSNDAWDTVPMRTGTFTFARRGAAESVSGLGAELPSLRERAGKYEYFVLIDDGTGVLRSVTVDRPVLARYKAPVPMWVLAVHIFVIFASMTIAVRTSIAALIREPYKRLIWATVVSLLLGGFIFGPLVQWYAFGVWWSGVPFGHDWTDNKVVVELLFWAAALFLNRGERRSRWSVLVAGIVTLAVYFIPHSIFGSEFDYTKGTGHGTAG